MKTIFAVIVSCLNVFCTALFLPVAVIVILLRPVFIVRVGYFSADRIGHLVFDLEYYLSKQRLQPKKNRVVDIFFFKGICCNNQLQVMASRQLRINKIST